MGVSYLSSEHNASLLFGPTTYKMPLAGQRTTATLDGDTQVAVAEAGTFANLCVACFTSLLDEAVTLRVNAVDTSLTVAIGTGTTGLFEDTSNTATISAGDLVNFNITNPGPDQSGFQRIDNIKVEFTATDTAVTVTPSAATSAAGVGLTTASATRYINYAGIPAAQSAEGDAAQSLFQGAGTWRNGWAYVKTNARTTASTIVSRIDAVDGNQSISITASTTGAFEDTSNSDVLTGGEEINWAHTNGTGTGTQTVMSVASAVEMTAPGLQAQTKGASGFNINAGAVRYIEFGQGAATTSIYVTAETGAESTVRGGLALENGSICIVTNTMSVNTIYTLRKNLADTAIVITFTLATTGRTTNTSDTVSFVAGDEIDWELDHPAGTGGASVSSLQANTAEGSSGTTIAAPVGALVLAGATPLVGTAFILEPAAGALTLGGLAPVAGENLQPTPAAGALAFGGLAPVSSQAVKASPGAGGLVLSGATPTVSVGLPVPAGTLTLLGLQPIPLHAGDSAALVLAGPAPRNLQNINRAPAAVALALGGLAPSIVSGSEVPTGALALLGLAPDTDPGIERPEPAALLLAGAAPGVVIGGIEVPAAGLVLAGLAPVTPGGDVTIPPAAYLTLAGQAPSIGAGPAPAAAALVLAGLAPTPAHGSNPPQGALVFVGETPTLASTGVYAGTGALVLAGLAPVGAVYGPFEPGAGALVLAGLAPGVGIPTAQLALQGQFPSIVAPALGVPAGGLTLQGNAEPIYVSSSIVSVASTYNLRRERIFPFTGAEQLWRFIDRLQVDAEVGVGLPVAAGVQGNDPQLMLQWSDDNGKTWSHEQWRTLGKAGKFNSRALWRRLGRSRKRTFRIACSDPVKIAFINAYINEQEGTS